MGEEFDWEITIKRAEEKGKVAIFVSLNLPPRSIRADLVVPYEDLEPILERMSETTKEMVARLKEKPVEVEA